MRGFSEGESSLKSGEPSTLPSKWYKGSRDQSYMKYTHLSCHKSKYMQAPDALDGFRKLYSSSSLLSCSGLTMWTSHLFEIRRYSFLQTYLTSHPCSCLMAQNLPSSTWKPILYSCYGIGPDGHKDSLDNPGQESYFLGSLCLCLRNG